MKKTFYLNLVLTTLFSVLLVSCSKEKISSPEIAADNTATMRLAPNTKYGGVTGVVNPSTVKAFIILSNDTGTFGPYYLQDDGSFKIGNLPAGNYKFNLYWVNTTSGASDSDLRYNTTVIEVTIEPGMITDMNKIYLK